MSNNRVFNFSAGPSVMPEAVLARAAGEMLSYGSSGMSVMEMSHRSPAFQDIFDATKAKFKRALCVPDSHEVLFLQGGATLQFAAIPMNLIEDGSADYAVTGNFSGIAAKEARKYGSVRIAADSSSTGHDRIPEQSELSLDDDARYFYYCANNTVYGTEWQYIPETKSPLVCDMSSNILSRPVDVSRFGLIYAGAQKNLAPAGLTVVIIDKSLAGRQLPCTPKVMSYDVLIENDSMLNTPPCWCIYMLGLTLDWIEEMGGVRGMEELRSIRSGKLYEFLDNSSFYTPHALPGSRSGMNVTFRTPSDALDKQFVSGAAARGLTNLKGHKVVGGIRASIYNAMPIEGVDALISYMKEFEKSHV